jgi:hypothetical protein
LFVGLCVVGVGIELARGYVGVTSMLEQNAVMAPLMEEMARATTDQAQASQNPQQKKAAEIGGKVMTGALAVGQVIGFVTLVGFLLMKVGFLVGCALYGGNEGVVRFFEARANPGA